MGTEIVKKESNLPVATNWGESQVDASNILLPRLLLMQGMSEFVSEGKAKLGDVVKSTTKEVIASKDKAIEILPLVFMENWILLEKVGSKFEFRSMEAVTFDNRNAELSFLKGGTEWRRDKCLDFYVLLKNELAREAQALAKIKAGEFPDPDDCLLPCFISFRRTSIKAGKEIVTHFAKTSHFNMPPFGKSLKLSSFTDKNDKGTYAIYKIEPGTMLSKEDITTCEHWYNQLRTIKPKVHEVEDVVEVTETVVVDENKSKF